MLLGSASRLSFAKSFSLHSKGSITRPLRVDYTSVKGRLHVRNRPLSVRCVDFLTDPLRNNGCQPPVKKLESILIALTYVISQWIRKVNAKVNATDV
jgi:hypothetical protein